MGRASSAKTRAVTKGALDGSWSPIPPECPNNDAEYQTHPAPPGGVFFFPSVTELGADTVERSGSGSNILL